ncbi:hypothetical protein ACNKHO_20200 [Shigella flexneri]
MTPQLQQAIRLLQLSTFELQQELQQALDSNPLLSKPIFMTRSTPSRRKTQKRYTVDALERRICRKNCRWMPAAYKYTAGTPSGTVQTTRTTSCRFIRAKQPRGFRTT